MAMASHTAARVMVSAAPSWGCEGGCRGSTRYSRGICESTLPCANTELDNVGQRPSFIQLSPSLPILPRVIAVVPPVIPQKPVGNALVPWFD